MLKYRDLTAAPNTDVLVSASITAQNYELSVVANHGYLFAVWDDAGAGTALVLGSTNNPITITDPCGGGGSTSQAPVISTANLIEGTGKTISGTGGVAGATIFIYQQNSGSSDSLLGQVVANGSNWTITSLTLTGGKNVYAKQTETNKAISVASNSVLVKNRMGTPTIVGSYGAGSNKTVSGTGAVAGGLIKIYQVESSGDILLGFDTAFSSSWTVQTLTLSSGKSIYAIQSDPNGINADSLQSNSIAIGASSVAPTITGSYTAGQNKTVSGTGVNGATIQLYLEAGSVDTLLNNTTITVSNGVWSISGLTLSQGDQLYAVQTEIGKGLSAPSAYAVVAAPNASGNSATPTITGTYTAGTSLTVSGTGVTGASISLYKNASLVNLSPVTVTNGVWQVTGLTLATNDTLYAIQTETGKNASAASATVTVGNTNTTPTPTSSGGGAGSSFSATPVALTANSNGGFFGKLWAFFSSSTGLIVIGVIIGIALIVVGLTDPEPTTKIRRSSVRNRKTTTRKYRAKPPKRRYK